MATNIVILMNLGILVTNSMGIWVISDSNNYALVFDTFDAAIEANLGAHPMFHSGRGFRYTNRAFHAKLEAVGMTQSI